METQLKTLKEKRRTRRILLIAVIIIGLAIIISIYYDHTILTKTNERLEKENKESVEREIKATVQRDYLLSEFTKLAFKMNDLEMHQEELHNTTNSFKKNLDESMNELKNRKNENQTIPILPTNEQTRRLSKLEYEPFKPYKPTN